MTLEKINLEESLEMGLEDQISNLRANLVTLDNFFHKSARA